MGAYKKPRHKSRYEMFGEGEILLVDGGMVGSVFSFDDVSAAS